LLLADHVSDWLVAISEMEPLPPGASTFKLLGLSEIVPEGAAS
jgi:hypothetical protein